MPLHQTKNRLEVDSNAQIGGNEMPTEKHRPYGKKLVFALYGISHVPCEVLRRLGNGLDSRHFRAMKVNMVQSIGGLKSLPGVKL